MVIYIFQPLYDNDNSQSFDTITLCVGMTEDITHSSGILKMYIYRMVQTAESHLTTSLFNS